MPGESAAPGSASGKTGSASAQTVGTGLGVSVRAVDAQWNLIVTNDTVALASSDPLAQLVTPTALTYGAANLGVTFVTAGLQTITASKVTHEAILAHTGSDTTVNPGDQTISFASPGYQTYGVGPINLSATATIATRSLAGVIDNDAVSLSGGTAEFDTAAVGTNKTVTVSGLTLTGSAANSYTLTQPILTADIVAGSAYYRAINQ